MKPFFDDDPGRGRGVGDAIHVLGIERERLFAQHVLAGGDGRERPRHVIAVGQRNVDGVDVRIGEQRVVAGDRARDLPLAGVGRRRGRDRGWRPPTSSLRRAARIAGIRRRLMRAVPRMPQRTVTVDQSSWQYCRAFSFRSQFAACGG